MRLGIIGLGRMGSSMALRLLGDGHECVVYDMHAQAVQNVVDRGGTGSSSLKEMVSLLETPRILWLMVPAGVVDSELANLVPLLEAGDIVIDGGNSSYRDDIRRGAELRPHGIHYVDVGTSGGVAGSERGYCLMIGGEAETVSHLTPIFATLAPGVDAAPPTPNRPGERGTAAEGFLHCGPHGAGHFVKMVHNGIEYGMMAAYAEGLDILHHADAGASKRVADAETTPMCNPEYFQYDLDLPEIAELWRRGSVISSWLLDLTAAALVDDADLAAYAGRVSDSGEGRWTVEAAVEVGVPAPVITAALFQRFSSRGEGDYANRVLSAMRKQFGGHDEK